MVCGSRKIYTGGQEEHEEAEDEMIIRWDGKENKDKKNWERPSIPGKRLSCTSELL